MRNEWDAIVMGLGAIGSGASYCLSRRLGDRDVGIDVPVGAVPAGEAD